MADTTPAASLRRGEHDYPHELLDLADPPEVLHVRGALSAVPRVAIVGSRAATPYGMAFAHRLARDLAELGVSVVSGLARGIDASAHRGALDAGGATIAVLPGGLEPVTPPSHAELADRVAASGALVAEWPAGHSVRAGMFLRRNRLIAALASATVVVEAAPRSGARSTAAVACSLGRPLLAVPGDVDRVTSRGCHALLRTGALVCEGAADVMRAIAAPATVAPAAESAPRAGRAGAEAGDAPRPDAQRVAAALDGSPRGLETVAADCGLSVERVLAALLVLEWSSIAVSHPGQRWSLRGAGSS